jgi:hypothetical protein
MKDGAVRLRKIALARDAWELVPGLATGMAVGADIAAAEPAVIRAIVIGTKMPRGIDGTPASPRQDYHRGWRARGFGTRIESLLTRLAYWFVDISGKGFGFFGALAAGLIWIGGRLGGGTSRIRPPDMEDEAEEHERNQ